MQDQVNIDPDILGGTPVFKGTTVPIAALFEYLRGQHSVKDFLRDFPTVRREQVDDILNEIDRQLVADVDVIP